MKRLAKSYSDYLRLPELLRLQRTLTSARDELHFIVVHQVFELWFKLSLNELEAARAGIGKDDLPRAVHALRRVHEVVKLLTASFPVLETMRPYDFLEFRNRLQPASGLQSLQFREIEFLCGLQDRRYVALFGRNGESRGRLERRAAEPTLWDAYVACLRRHRLLAGSDRAIVKSVVKLLRSPDRHPLGPLTEALVDLDQGFSSWRLRHISMVMRMIGSRPGTGQQSVGKLVARGYEQMGEGGVDYLKTTLGKVFFPLLWEARTMLTR
ncbi:MAG: tryptophan 2,3-dioxygenase family protein [Planctomycetales bacterium]|nr:tryptophan 2,3-dioxygenase family protein [Planctomycetales bacterium]